MERRKFLSNLFTFLGTGLGYKIFPSLRMRKSEKRMSEKSRIISVFHPEATDGTDGKDNANLNEKVVKKMVDEGIKKLTGINDLVKAWTSIIPDPNKKIAIKVNCQIQGIYTKAKVIKPITDGLILRGVSPDDILIYDRTDNAFKFAGFERNFDTGIKIGTVKDFGGYSKLILDRLANLLIGGYSNPYVNFIYQLSSRSQLKFPALIASSIIPNSIKSYNCEYLINVPVLKAMDILCGVSLSMKNHYGSIAGPTNHHEDVMEYIPYINSRPPIRNKTRLVVLDAIFCEYKWVNGRSQEFVSKTNKIILSKDPVALDYIGWNIIEKERAKNGLQPLSPGPDYINKAAKLGLGHKDSGKLEYIKINLGK